MQTRNVVEVLLIAASLLIAGASWAAKPRVAVAPKTKMTAGP